MDIEERIRQRNLASLLPSDDENSSSDDDVKPAVKSAKGKGIVAASKGSGKLAAAETVLDDDGDDDFGPSTAASKKAGAGRPRNVKAEKEAVGRKRKRGDDVEDLLEGVDDPGMRLLLRLGSGDIDAAAAVDGLSRAQAKEDKRKKSRKHPDSEDEDESGGHSAQPRGSAAGSAAGVGASAASSAALLAASEEAVRKSREKRAAAKAAATSVEQGLHDARTKPPAAARAGRADATSAGAASAAGAGGAAAAAASGGSTVPVTICFQSASRKPISVKIRANTQFSRAFEAYATRYGLELGQLVFEFDGDELSANGTPEGAGMDAVEGETNKFTVDVLER